MIELYYKNARFIVILCWSLGFKSNSTHVRIIFNILNINCTFLHHKVSKSHFVKFIDYFLINRVNELYIESMFRITLF